MAEKAGLPAIRIPPPGLTKSSSFRLSKYHIPFTPSTPSPIIYQRPSSGRLWVAILLQVSSVYAVHRYLRGNGQPAEDQPSLVKFAVLTFVGTSLVLGSSQRPWKGRAISSSQWTSLSISGALVAISFLLRMRGLADVGPLETVLAEYAGAVIGKVLITAERRVHGIRNAKVRGLLAFLVGLFLLSQGWAISPCSPLSSLFVPATKSRRYSSAKLTRATRIGYSAESRAYLAGNITEAADEDCSMYVRILAPVFAGLLSSMQKLVPSVTSLAGVPKKRVQVLTYVTAGVVLVPVMLFQFAFFGGRGNGGGGGGGGGPEVGAIWPLVSMIMFGMVVVFYGESFAEDQLLIFPLSPFHFFATVCSVCFFELVYGSNFSLLGFVVCSGILALGVRSAAFICGGRDLKGLSEKEEYAGSSLISMIKTPMYHIWTDVKTRKIAMFLLLNTSFMGVEFLYGFLSNSLGLISDACHMLFDCAALAIGLYASYISRLPPNSNFNYGYGRFEVLSGYANAVFLILVASLIVLESLERLLEPPEMSTESLLLVSVGGLLVNIVGLVFFHEAHHHSHGGGPCTHSHGHDSHSHSHSHSHKQNAPLLSHWESDGKASFSPRFPNSPAIADRREEPHLLTLQGPMIASDYDHDHQICRIGDSGRHNFGLTNAALNHGYSANDIIGHHKESHAGSNDPAHHQFDSAHQDHDHSGVFSRERSLRHSQAGESSALQPSSHHHGNQHDQRNPFVQEAPSQSPRPHFKVGSLDHHHHHGHGHLDSLERPLVQQPHGVTNGEAQTLAQIRIDDEEHTEIDPGVSFTSPSKIPVFGHECNGESTFEDKKHQDHLDRKGEELESYAIEKPPQHSHDHGRQLFLDENGSQVRQSDGGSGFKLGHGDHNHHERPEDQGKDQVPGSHLSHSNHDHRRGHRHEHDHGSQDVGVPHHRHRHGHGDHRHEHHQGHEEHHGHHHHTHDDHNHHEHDRHHDLAHEDHDPHEHHGHHHHAHDDHGHHHDQHHHHHSESHSSDHHHHHHHSHEGHDEHIDHDHIDHNMEGIFLHILADTLGSVGVVISTLLMKYKGWVFTDPLCSIFISILIVASVVPLVRNSAELLLQRVPRSAEGKIQKALRKVEEVEGVHDWHKLHVWSYSNTELVGTLRLHAAMGTDKQLVRKKVTGILMEAGVMDSTVEVEDLEHEVDQ